MNVCVDPKLSPPTDIQCKLLRQIVLAGLADHVARYGICFVAFLLLAVVLLMVFVTLGNDGKACSGKGEENAAKCFVKKNPFIF